LEATKAANKAENKLVEPQKKRIQFDDFAKIFGRPILEAEKMPESKQALI
jgi:methionyl-tRNA synthetase